MMVKGTGLYPPQLQHEAACTFAPSAHPKTIIKKLTHQLLQVVLIFSAVRPTLPLNSLKPMLLIAISDAPEPQVPWLLLMLAQHG